MEQTAVEPTVDLRALYKGHHYEESEMADFVQLQWLLSNRDRALPHLQFLNKELVAAGAADELAAVSGTREKAKRASEILDRVMRPHEIKCGLGGEAPMLCDFASADDFKTFTKEGRHFFDTGAGAVHGEMTHRIQWFILMGAITDGKFDGGIVKPYSHTVAHLFAASMSDAYETPANSPTTRSYMWDWVVDRIKGQVPGQPPDGLDFARDYKSDRDAWTHPGENGEQGALSNDILSASVSGLEALTLIRKLQVDGHQEVKVQFGTWFEAAKALGVGEGLTAVTPHSKDLPRTPTYFYPPSPQVLDALRAAQKVIRDAVAVMETWQLSVKRADFVQCATDLEAAMMKARSAIAGMEASTRQRLGSALIQAWFGAIVRELKSALDFAKGDVGEAYRLQLTTAIKALKSSPAWAIDLT